MAWADFTIYKPDEQRGVTPPRSFKLTLEHLEITIHCGFADMADRWFYTCREMGINSWPLESLDIAGAQEEAVMEVFERVSVCTRNLAEYIRGTA